MFSLRLLVNSKLLVVKFKGTKSHIEIFFDSARGQSPEPPHGSGVNCIVRWSWRGGAVPGLWEEKEVLRGLHGALVPEAQAYVHVFHPHLNAVPALVSGVWSSLAAIVCLGLGVRVHLFVVVS